MDLYREEILDHWQNPSNFGSLADFDSEAEAINPLCGDQIKIQVKLESNVHRGGVIRDLRFMGSGCAISIASASILSEYIKDKTLNDLEKITGQKVLNLLGGKQGFPPARLKCAFLALEAIRKVTSNT